MVLDMGDETEPMTVKQAAAAIGVAEMTVVRYAKAGTLRAWKVSNRWRIDRSDVEALAEYRRTGARRIIQ